MAKVIYDKQNFLDSLEPGIVALVFSAFEKKLGEKLDAAVEETYEELKKELPDEIKARVIGVFRAHMGDELITVEVKLEDNTTYPQENNHK